MPAFVLVAATTIHAQAPLGSLKTEGAEVSGMVAVSDGRATIGNSAAVTAGALPAQISLKRGGEVKVCAGSAIHISQTTMTIAKPPLMLALDRGAVEIHTSAEKTDSILTPDLRFELSGAAALDLRIRVVPSGDTCVENVGKDAPVLHVTQTFGDATYFIRPGQRVLFERGSLREVVDHEANSCGCPRNGDNLVLAGKGKHGDGKIPEAVRTNPFPEAVSQGLVRPDTPQAPVGEVHAQVTSQLSYSGETGTASGPPGQTTTPADVAAVSAPPAIPAATVTSQTPTPANRPAPPAPDATDMRIESAAPPPAGPNPFHAIGRFFRRIFGVSK
ncbi:nuclease [Terriglobus roseus]|nr:nuclease [Terriglobus roseus]